MLSDIEEQLKFPSDIVEARLRPDLVIFSRSAKAQDGITIMVGANSTI